MKPLSGESFAPTGDIINDICRRFRQLDAEIEQALADRVEREARQAYALERVYIASNVQKEKQAQAALIDPDRPLSVQARELGLGRATIWRHIKKRREV